MLLVAVFALALGLCIGSFLNVVVYRLPRGESLNHPSSHCPNCDHPVRPYDNVPVLSWLVLRGRCRDCGNPISARYPAVELLTGLLWLAVVLARWDDAAEIVLGIALITLLVPVVFIDLEHRLIPDKLTLPFAVAAIVIGVALDPGGLPEQLIAGAGGFLFFFVAWYLKPGGMGFGDVKLAGVMGLYLGRAVAPAILIALVAGVAVGGAIIARVGGKAGMKTAVPFGPFLALGGAICVFVGDALVDLYLDTF